VEASEPARYAWIVPGRLAVAERPGRGGRSHRRALRIAETAWWRERGVASIVSCMRTRHALAEYAEEGLVVRWHPLGDPDRVRADLREVVATARELMGSSGGGVLVHCDRANEWLAGIDAALRLGLGLVHGPAAALRAAEADGLPVGSLAASMVGRRRAPAAA
jgi:hypothetical protein